MNVTMPAENVDHLLRNAVDTKERYEEKINAFLDKINLERSYILENTELILGWVEILNFLSCIEGLSKNDRMKVRTVILLSCEISQMLENDIKRREEYCNSIGVHKKDLAKYKKAYDLLTETNQDLKYIYDDQVQVEINSIISKL